MHPQSRMQNKKAYERSHHGHTGFTRHSPRNGFTAYSALFPVIGLVVTVIGGILPANLTPASRRQNHTTSPSASVLFVRSTSASIASRPAFVTIANRPSSGTRPNRSIAVSIQASSVISEIQKRINSWEWVSQKAQPIHGHVAESE